jgi:hypothetical protein
VLVASEAGARLVAGPAVWSASWRRVGGLVASRRGTWAVSSAGERFPDTEEVTGSNPVRPTSTDGVFEGSGLPFVRHTCVSSRVRAPLPRLDNAVMSVWSQVGVTLCGPVRLMPKQIPDVHQRHPVHDQPAGGGVPHHLRGEPSHSGFLDSGIPDPIPEVPVVDWSSTGRGEHERVPRAAGHQCRHGRHDGRGNRHRPVGSLRLGPLPQPVPGHHVHDGERSTKPVDPVRVQSVQLTRSQAHSHAEFYHRPGPAS